MNAVDTNILVYAHRSDSPWHEAAYAVLGSLSGTEWAIPWPCIHEFLAIVTHPKIFDPPTPLADAVAAVESWRRLRGGNERVADAKRRVLREVTIRGP